jgi:D-psicose/D-tagatose/L-ribulose 3-epimerase
MKLGVNTLVWCLPFTERNYDLFEKVGGFGFDVIELVPGDEFRKLNPERIRERLQKNKLEAAVCVALSEANDISSLNQSIRNDGIHFINDLIDWTEKLGAKLIGGPIYSELGKKRYLPLSERNAEKERSKESLKRVGEYAAKKGIVIAIEPINRFETDMVNTAEQARELCEAVNNPSIRMMLDTFHMNIEEKNLKEAIRSSRDFLVHFHLCSNDRGIPGSGHIEWQEVVQALKDINYKGFGVIESFDFEETGPQTMIWRHLAPSPDAMAKEGIKFLRGIFT